MKNDDPRAPLIIALANACEHAILETDITPQGILEALCTTISWAVANTQPEFHEKFRTELTGAIPQIFEQAQNAQQRSARLTRAH